MYSLRLFQVCLGQGFTVVGPNNINTCGHIHNAARKALRCLLTYGRLEQGYRLIYVDRNYWYVNGSRQESDRRLEMSDFNDATKRELRKAYTNFRRKYNPNLPEEFI